LYIFIWVVVVVVVVVVVTTPHTDANSIQKDNHQLFLYGHGEFAPPRIP
jgi:hypothetical protein